MTHPIEQPRNGKRVGEAPPPIEHMPRGCPGHHSAIQGRVAALCLLCERLPIGGPQMAPAWARVEGHPYCPNFLAHNSMVEGLQPGRQSVVQGGCGAEKNTAREGVSP